MAQKLKLSLPTLDEILHADGEPIDPRRSKDRILNIPLEEIHPFPNHPYKVKIDLDMDELVESIKTRGLLHSALVRPDPEGEGYQMIAGHRRLKAFELAGFGEIPCIVREMDDDEAVLAMVDSNLQREKILPSEKAFAYKLRLEAMKRKVGRPSKENCAPVGHNFEGKKSRDIFAEEVRDSKSQIQRFIRLTNLIPELLELVDEGRIALRPAVELSYLTPDEQTSLHETIETDECTPSLAQAQKMRQFSLEEHLNDDVILSIMSEEKPNQREQFKMPRESISRFFPMGTPPKTIEETIIKALELYERQQRSRDDTAR